MSYLTHTKKRKMKRKKRRKRKRHSSKKINIQYKKRRKPFFTVKKHNYMPPRNKNQKTKKVYIIPDTTRTFGDTLFKLCMT